MRKLLFICLFSALLTAPSNATITMVQCALGGSVSSTGSGTQTFTTSPAAFPSPTTAGNLLVLVAWQAEQSSVDPTQAGYINTPLTSGFTWVALPGPILWGGYGSSTQLIEGMTAIFYIANAASMGAGDFTTVSGSPQTAGSYNIQYEFSLCEFAGAATLSALETHASANANVSLSVPETGGGTITTANVHDLIVMSFTANRATGSGISAGTGYTLGPSAAVATLGQSQYLLDAPLGVNVRAFGGNETSWACATAVFKAAASRPAISVLRHKGSVF